MLHRVSFKNFCSFREGATISFELDGKVPPGVAGSHGLSTAVALKGANASGKTQALKALSFIANFCSRSFEAEPEAPIVLSPFFESDDTSEFEVEFSLDGTLYIYKLACKDTGVVYESVTRRTRSRKTKVIERTNNEITKAIGEFSELKSIKVRSNASLIATAHQYEISSIRPIRDFFFRILSNVSFSGLKERFASIALTAKFLHERNQFLAPISNFIKECDTGITRIEILKGKSDKGEEAYFPIFVHHWNGEERPITEYEESSGTKFLLRILPQILLALQNGSVIVLDELDMHLHPFIVKKIVNLFINSDTNKMGAQLLCSTHDSDVLDQLGKYRVYLVNKHENESFLYRLDEVPGELIRNDRSIIPLYKDAKIGGVPRI